MKEQLKQIMKISKNTEFYSSLFNENKLNIDDLDETEFSNIPIITKQFFRENTYKFINSKLVTNANKHQIKTIRTSGSTGKFTEIFWLNDDFNRSNIVLWRLREKWYGITPASKCVSFNSSVYNGNRIEKAEKIKYYSQNMLGFSKFWMSDSDFLDYLNEMEKYQPDWMLIQPSTCLKLIDVLKKNNLQISKSIKYIELNGEFCTIALENYIRSFFRIQVANMYGANEVNAIAYECPHHNMHVLEDNVYLESVDYNGHNVAIVTSLKNTAMPLIRYNLDDEISLEKKVMCTCGLRSDIIRIFKGRAADLVSLSENHYVSPYIVVYAIERINSIIGNAILQFQILKKGNKITVVIVLNDKFEGWGETIKTELLNELNNNVVSRDINFDVLIQKDIICDYKHKFQMVIID